MKPLKLETFDKTIPRKKARDIKLTALQPAQIIDPPEQVEPRKTSVSKESKFSDESQSSLELPKFGTPVVPQYRSYEVPHFKKMKRLDVRLTKEQKRFLEDLEDQIREDMPEGESENPNSRRITKASIVRVMVEFFRQMNTPIDASAFKNENDLLEEWFNKLTA